MVLKTLFGNTALRNAPALLCSVSALTMASAAYAQANSVPPSVPPVFSEVDANGVDLTTGALIVSRSDISIGEGDSTLSYGEVSGSKFGRRELNVLSLKIDGGFYYFSTADKTTVFKYVGSTLQPVTQDGSKLEIVGQSWVFTGRDGTVATLPITNQIITPGSVVNPNGKTTTFYWEQQGYFVPNPACSQPTAPGDPACTPKGTTVWKSRLKGIENNYGYGIKFQYAEPGTLTQQNAALWVSKTSATSVNLSRSACDLLAATSCSNIRGTQTVNYVDEGNGNLAVVDALNQTTRYRYDIDGRLVGVRNPGSVDDDLTIAYSDSRVSSVTRKSGTWLYSYALTASTLTTTAKDSAGGTKTVITNLSNGRPSSMTSETGKSYAYTYDDYSRLKTLKAPSGSSQEWAYDSRGNVTESSRVSSDLVSRTKTVSEFSANCDNYKVCNLPNSVTDANTNKTNIAYDSASGGVSAISGPLGLLVNSQYQNIQFSYYRRQNAGQAESLQRSPGADLRLPSGQIICKIAVACSGSASESRTSLTRNDNGSVASVTQSAGDSSVLATVTTTYDDVGNVSTVDGPASGSADTTRYLYDANRRRTATISPDPDGDSALRNPMSRTTFDARGRVTAQDTGTSDNFGENYSVNRAVSLEYDAADRKVRETQTAGGVTFGVKQFSYNTANQIECIVLRMDSSRWNNQTDACAPQADSTGGPDRVVRMEYFADGQLKSRTSGYGTNDAATERFAYTPNSQIQSITDGKGNVTTNAYDGFDRLQTKTYPGGSYEQLAYDANGNVTSQRKRDGRTLTFGYDALNRMASKTVPNARSVFYAYDLTGAMTEAHFDSLNGADYVKNTYNALGQVTTSTTSMGGSTRALSYTYDAAGNRAQITHPDGTAFRYDYDNLGRLNHLKDGANNQLGLYVYLDNGKLTWRGQGANGTGYGYDAMGRILSYNMQRLNGGSVTAVNTALSYNAASQIVQQTRNSDAYAYTDTRNVDRNFATNGLNQYTDVGPDKYSYDANGNLTSDGGNTYTYDAENRLTGVSGAHRGSLVYDPIGRLWQTSGSSGVTQFLYDGDQLVAEYNNTGGLLRRYVQGTGNDDPLLWYEGASTSPYRLYTDHLGSVVGIIQDDGTMRQINTYDEYGVPGSGNLGRFQYTGQAWIPELGLYYYKARMYSPMLGRFMQTDPIGYGDGLNWYNYVGGDPVNATDSSGTEKLVGSDVKPYSDAPIYSGNVVVTARPLTRTGIYLSSAPGQGLQGADEEIMVTAQRRKSPYYYAGTMPSQVATPQIVKDTAKKVTCAVGTAFDAASFALGAAGDAIDTALDAVHDVVFPPACAGPCVTPGQARQALSNGEFRRWFHQVYKQQQGFSGGGRNNPDMNPADVMDAYDEWQQNQKKPKPRC